jgi:hypothetical protein
MSYDILVFDPAHAPSERETFLEWWDRQSDWSEPHPYNDPAFTTPKLSAWFFEMIERFPALNGPHAASRDQRSADYCVGYYLIYVAISFDKQATHERAFELAGKHALGFFEASSPDGEIWLPENGTELVLSSKHQEKPPKPITDRRIAALVSAHPPEGVIVWDCGFADNPRRLVHVVYSTKNFIEAIAPSREPQRSLAQLESMLTYAGTCFAVVEQHEQRSFGRQLSNAMSAARKGPSLI